MDARARKRTPGTDGFRAGHGKNGGGSAAIGSGGLSGERIRTRRIAAACGESLEVGFARKRKCVAAAQADNRRTVRTDEWAHRGNAPSLRNGRACSPDRF